MTTALTHDNDTILLEAGQIAFEDIDWLLSPEVDEQVEYEAWKAKREQDIAWCGKIETRIKPGTKKIEYYSVPCNEPDCPKCGPRIRAETKTNLSKILADRPLRHIILSGTIEQQKKERARIMRQYGKAKVTTAGNDLLTDDGLELQIEMYIDTSDEIGEECIEISDEDTARFCQKSFNCKHSGSLHKSKAVVKAVEPGPEENESVEPEVLELEMFDPEMKIECETWQTDVEDESMLRDLDRQAHFETINLNPKTFSELIRDLKIWTAARRRIYEENDVVILSNKTTKVVVKMSEIDWQWTGKKQSPG